MADSVKGRRKKTEPTTAKQDVAALRAANVPRARVAEVLGRRFKSVGAQRAAINALIREFGGTHAPQIAQQARRR